MPQFGVRLSDELTDIDQVVQATGLATDAVQRDLADGYLARGLTRDGAERMVASLATAGLTAEVCASDDAANTPPPSVRLGALGGGLGSRGLSGGGGLSGGLGGGLLGTNRGLSGLAKGGLAKRGPLPGLGLMNRSPTTTILGPPAPAELETDRVEPLPPPSDGPDSIDLPPPVMMRESMEIPPVSLPPPTSDAELMPSLKVADPAALPPPKVFEVSKAPPAPTHTAPPFRSISQPVERRVPPRSSAPPSTINSASVPPSQMASQPPQPPVHQSPSRPVVAAPAPRVSVPLTDPSMALMPEAPRASRVPWIIAATLIIVSGVLVAWAWSGRDAGLNALRRAEVMYAQGNYGEARLATERARAHGADIWADRMTAAIAAGPHLDEAIAKLNGDDLDAAQQALNAATALAPKDARTLQVTVDLMRQRAAVKPWGNASAKSRAPASVAPTMVASTAPRSLAPASVAPSSVAPASMASTAPASVAPTSVAPASIASAAPVSAALPSTPRVQIVSNAPQSAPPADEPPKVRFARPASAPTRDRSKVARLKIVGELVGEIVVDGTRVSVAVPGWIEVPPGRRKIAVRGVDGEIRGLRAVKVKAGRRATVRLRAAD